MIRNLQVLAIALLVSPISLAKPFRYPRLACEIKNLIINRRRVFDVINSPNIILYFFDGFARSVPKGKLNMSNKIKV